MQSLSKLKLRNINALEAFLLFTGIAVFAIICINSVYNIPSSDDYSLSLRFYSEFCETDGLDAKLNLLWANIAEHRVVSYKLSTILSKDLFGEINFKWITHTGNIFYVLFAVLVFFHLKSIFITEHTVVSFVVLSLILVPTYVLNTHAISAIVQSPLMFLAFIVFMKSNEVNSFIGLITISILTFVCCSLFGNGLFVLPLGVFILFLRKEFRNSIAFSFIGLFIYYIFFLNHTGFGTNLSSESFVFSSSMTQGLLIFIGSPFKTVLGYSHFACSIIGAVILISWIYIAFKSIRTKILYPTLALGCFGFLSGGVTILLRVSNNLQLNKAMIDRYSFYAIFVLISLITAAFYHYRHLIKSRHLVSLILPLFLILYVTRLSHSQNLLHLHSLNLRQSIINFHIGRNLNVKHYRQSSKHLRSSVANGDFNLASMEDLLDYPRQIDLDQKPQLSNKKFQSDKIGKNIMRIDFSYPQLETLGLGWDSNDGIAIFEKFNVDNELILGESINRHAIHSLQFGFPVDKQDDHYDYFFFEEDLNELFFYYKEEGVIYYSKL